MAGVVEAYVAFWQGLSPDRLDELDGYYTPDVRFVDPFNDIRGLAGLRSVLTHMYQQCEHVAVTVDEINGRPPVVYLRWRFSFRLRGDRRDRSPIEGVSRVVFAPDGRVSEHIDYWDAAGQLYSQFPLVGGLMRWLRRRLAAPTPTG